MNATVRKVGRVSIVELHGKIVAQEGDVVLRERIREILESGDKEILLNLERVPYMDSAGLVGLVECYRSTEEKGGIMKLLKPSDKVSDLLRLTELDKIFDAYDDEQKALLSFS